MAATLGRLGFQVRKVTDGTFDDMRKALLEFNRNARGAEIALVFFAGHGIEVGGENYLIPIDAELKSDIDVDHEAIGLKALLPSIETASQLGLVILDACRNNPFNAKMQRTVRTRSVSRGLASVEPTGNVLVAYAARDGTTAADGDGRNSPFTTSLLKHIETPGLEINYLFRNVRDDVIRATKKEQTPFVYGSLSKEQIFFKAPVPVAAEPKGPGADEVIWSALKETNDVSSLQRFITQFPKSAHRSEAEKRVAAINAEAAAAAAAAPKAPAADEVVWGLVKDTKDSGQLRLFIEQYPKSAMRGEAEKRLAALNAEAAAAAKAAAAAAAEAGKQASGPAADEVVWNLVKDTRDSGQLKLFIEQYPKSARRGEAEKRIAAINAETAGAAAKAKAEAERVKAEAAKAVEAAKAEAAKAAAAKPEADKSAATRAAPGGGGGGKCFTFNNRRFCE